MKISKQAPEFAFVCNDSRNGYHNPSEAYALKNLTHHPTFWQGHCIFSSSSVRSTCARPATSSCSILFQKDSKKHSYYTSKTPLFTIEPHACFGAPSSGLQCFLFVSCFLGLSFRACWLPFPLSFVFASSCIFSF